MVYKYKKVSKLTRVGYECAESSDGYKEWFLNGKLHREDGPAFEHPNGFKAWWSNGEQIITLETKSDDPKILKLQDFMKIQEVLEK
jgi:hypothetical protein